MTHPTLEISALKVFAMLKMLDILVTRDTSHSLIEPCVSMLQLLAGPDRSSSRHFATRSAILRLVMSGSAVRIRVSVTGSRYGLG